ncbi:MAG: hypothetical protein AB1486_23010 [Planctomycetota bacterium]
MRSFGLLAGAFVFLTLSATAQDVPPQHLNVTNTDGACESYWVVSFPSGSADFFNSRYDGLQGRPIAGVSTATADFGSGTSYPRTGLFPSNFSLDPTGNTPDLTSGCSADALPGGGMVYNYVYGAFSSHCVPYGEPNHVATQFPPGDSATLAIANDDTSTTLFSGWTQDGYSTPAYGGYNFGLNAVVDRVAELQGAGPFEGGLVQYLYASDERGDFLTATVATGDFYGLLYDNATSGVLWQIWLSFLGAPFKRVSPTLFTFPSGGGSYLRAGDPWPYGFGGFTFYFVAVSGMPGVPGSVRVSNEVMLVTLADAPCNWGIKDDGTFESGWVVSIPTGPSDFFSNYFNCGFTPPVNNVTDFKVAVADFGSSYTAYPLSGVFIANATLDPSGWTPDLSHGWGVQPFTFPHGGGGTTTSGFCTNDINPDIPYSTFGTDDVHGVIQLPPGDSGWLGILGDTTPTPTVTWGSTSTNDGYRTPANRFDAIAGWGLRLGSN